MTYELASRVRSMQPSATLAITQKAKELKDQGVDVISFGVGQPDFITPEPIREAAKAAMDEGHTGYTTVRGVNPLLEAIRDESHRRRGVTHDTSEIVASCGAKHTLFNLALALYEPGDEVIVPAPYWVSYPAQVSFVGAIPKVVSTQEEDGFRLTPELLKANVSVMTKAVILCSPSNPTGAAYAKEHLEPLAAALKDTGDYWILVDEIYGELTYDGFEQHSLVSVAPELRDRLIIVDGVSKTYAMTGWRIGYAAGPEPLIKAIAKIQSQSTSNPSSISQWAAVEALNGPQDFIAEHNKVFRDRRDLVVSMLNQGSGLSCPTPEGAFYVFPSCAGAIGRTSPSGKRLDTDQDFVTELLDAEGVAVVHGSAFGLGPNFRISYATATEALEEACARIQRFCGRLD